MGEQDLPPLGPEPGRRGRRSSEQQRLLSRENVWSATVLTSAVAGVGAAMLAVGLGGQGASASSGTDQVTQQVVGDSGQGFDDRAPVDGRRFASGGGGRAAMGGSGGS